VNILAQLGLAFAIGLSAVAGAQYWTLWSATRAVNNPGAVTPAAKPAYSFDQHKMVGPVIPKMAPIDTRIGQRAMASAINRQINLSIRAGQNVPQPKIHYVPGMRRY
jgi:hypothetical protein